ncbi:ABC transporter ATP-binding protein [Candidatus Shapirobacteria bacterium]|nr:ABC transporter ATP-binding protein [Candidatus Shapirobacteria bacterium]
MYRSVPKVFKFIFKVITDRSALLFWTMVRFISAVLPLITIFLYSRVISQLELKLPLKTIILTIFLIFLVRLADNYLRLISISKLEELINGLSFDIHNYFLSDLKSENRVERNATVQAIRNFSDAASTTLNLIKQPGIDSIVSLFFIPVILFFIDFPSFIITITYSVTYFFVDIYTTQRYSELKDIQNSKTEAYYAKLQEAKDFDLEQISYTRHFHRLTHWSFNEWSILQNTSVVFYVISLLYLTLSVYSGNKDLSTLVLIMGYITQTQTYLNAFSSIMDSTTDMNVGLHHLAKNKTITAIDIDDLT